MCWAYGVKIPCTSFSNILMWHLVGKQPVVWVHQILHNERVVHIEVTHEVVAGPPLALHLGQHWMQEADEIHSTGPAKLMCP